MKGVVGPVCAPFYKVMVGMNDERLLARIQIPASVATQRFQGQLALLHVQCQS
jgi:hypothetical protein